MSNEESLSNDDRAMAASLSKLRPISTGLTASGLLEEAMRRNDADRRAARRQTMIWKVASGSLAASLLLVIWTHSREAHAPQTVEVQSGATTANVALSHAQNPNQSTAYLDLRRRVLAEGLRALPSEPTTDFVSEPLPGEELPRHF